MFAALFAAADVIFAQLLTALAPDVGVSDVVLPADPRLSGRGGGGRGGVLRADVGRSVDGAPVAEPTRLRIPRIPVSGRVECARAAGGARRAVRAVRGGAGCGPVRGQRGAARRRRAPPGHAIRARRILAAVLGDTLLTLCVIALTLHTVPRDRPSERRLATRLVAVLAVCALVIGAASLHRTRAYVCDFGLDRPRLVMGGVELWLCAVLVLVLLGLACAGRRPGPGACGGGVGTGHLHRTRRAVAGRGDR
ncbi:DUF4153 domain-containing protein [Yinghuangia aomiensis]